MKFYKTFSSTFVRFSSVIHQEVLIIDNVETSICVVHLYTLPIALNDFFLRECSFSLGIVNGLPGLH